MTPILYNGDETAFASAGLGALSECLRCIVTEERNGIFECEFDYPVSGALFEDVKEGNIIAVTHDNTGDKQPFDIYARSAPINGIVTFYAHHISYRLGHVLLKPTSATSCAAALAKLETDTYNRNPFTFWTDKNVSANWSNAVPQAVKAVLGGQEGSILDVYGKGEYKWDKWSVKLYTNRGADNGVSVRYGVNMSDIRQDIDISGCYAAVAPFWSGEAGTVTLPEGFITGNTIPVRVYNLTNDDDIDITDADGDPIELAAAQINPVPMDLTNDFQDPPTVEELRALALSRLNNAQPWNPSENITVSFVELSRTTDYSGYKTLAAVNLCDTVTIYNELLGIGGVKSKVIKTTWNALTDEYESIELGTAATNFSDVVTAQIEAATERLTTVDYMQTAVKDATAQITGALGGYVVIMRDADGNPTEICIMDTPDILTAVNVWRWNKNGLGHSHNGYNGPYDDIAMTQDGKINASMITAGILNANLIRAGVIQDQTGTSYWNLVTGVMNIIGQFAAQTSNAYGTFRMELTDGAIKLYRTSNNTTTNPGTIQYNEYVITTANGNITKVYVGLEGNAVALRAGNGDDTALVHCKDTGEVSLKFRNVKVYSPSGSEGVTLEEDGVTGAITLEIYEGIDPNTGLETWTTVTFGFTGGICTMLTGLS